MSFHTSCVCDACEQDLEADNEEVALEQGWILVRYGYDDGETTRDFCSMRCLIRWASRGTMDVPDPAKGIKRESDDAG